MTPRSPLADDTTILKNIHSHSEITSTKLIKELSAREWFDTNKLSLKL